MDLTELTTTAKTRHPWETARVTAIKKLIKPLLEANTPLNVMDIGCGDGFVSRKLFGNYPSARVTCIDINLTEPQIESFSNLDKTIQYQRQYPPPQTLFDLVIMLDVVEHEANDYLFLSRIVSQYLAPGGSLLLTAPAFQSLFSAHDRLLKHYRRYNRRGLNSSAAKSGLFVNSSGYLFGSLLVPRFLSLIAQRTIGEAKISPKGVGGWGGGPWVTSLTELALNVDNTTLYFLSRCGVTLPGLSVWALCEKPS